MTNQTAQAGTVEHRCAKRAIQNRKGFPWLLMSPTLAVLALLRLFPFIYAMRMAAFNISISKPYLPLLFMGLDQYKGPAA